MFGSQNSFAITELMPIMYLSEPRPFASSGEVQQNGCRQTSELMLCKPRARTTGQNWVTLGDISLNLKMTSRYSPSPSLRGECSWVVKGKLRTAGP